MIYERLIARADAGEVKTVRQVFDEIQSDVPVYKILGPHRSTFVVPIEEQYAPEVQAIVERIGNDAPFLVPLTGGKNPEPADPFLIAVAAAYGYTLVTNESPLSPYKIPAVCKLPGITVKCISGAHFLVEVGIVQQIQLEHLDPARFFRGANE
jgi:hypothetical protein